MIASSCLVFGEESLNTVRVEQSLLAEPVGRELLGRESGQLVLQPLGDGNAKSFLGSVQHVVREFAMKGLLQQVFPIAALQLE